MAPLAGPAIHLLVAPDVPAALAHDLAEALRMAGVPPASAALPALGPPWTPLGSGAPMAPSQAGMAIALCLFVTLDRPVGAALWRLATTPGWRVLGVSVPGGADQPAAAEAAHGWFRLGLASADLAAWNGAMPPTVLIAWLRDRRDGGGGDPWS